jgi:hypothetical protein
VKSYEAREDFVINVSQIVTFAKHYCSHESRRMRWAGLVASIEQKEGTRTVLLGSQ